MTKVAVESFGVASKVSEVKRWFAQRRMHKLVPGEAKLKRRCGMVEPGVLGQVERLVAQARGQLAIDGRCTVSNLKQILEWRGLIASEPKPEPVQRVYNNLANIQAALGVQVEVASGVEEHLDEVSNKEDDDDVVCEMCGGAEEMDGNSILLCDGSHSVAGGKSVGCHQLCCTPL